jgi:AcrR family transcriptional regulator
MNEKALEFDPRRERTRRALLDGGRRVMAAKGVEGATVLEIVREAGVSQPSFYNHFQSKEKLVNAIVADFFQSDAAYKIRVFDAFPPHVDDIDVLLFQFLQRLVVKNTKWSRFNQNRGFVHLLFLF